MRNAEIDDLDAGFFHLFLGGNQRDHGAVPGGRLASELAAAQCQVDLRRLASWSRTAVGELRSPPIEFARAPFFLLLYRIP